MTPPSPPAAPARIVLGPDEARRIAVASALPPGGFPDVRAALAHLGIVQLDAIAVLARAHHLTLAARVPGSGTEAVARALDAPEAPLAFDCPAHALSLVPLAHWPLWAFRRRRARAHAQYPDPARRADLLARVRDAGPSTLRRLRPADEARGTGWDTGPTRMAAELLVWSGELVCLRREGGHRVLDLPERALPAALAAAPEPEDAVCLAALLTHAGRVLGVADLADLADHLRIPRDRARAALPDTPLVPVRVAGEPGERWAHPRALIEADRTPPPAADPAGARFLSPFDPLLWHRPRVRRLFGFTHLLEAYKPAARREHGYYVCPLLLGDRLIGRADLARRAPDVLTVLRVGFEGDAGRTVGARAATVDAAFAAACRSMAADVGRRRVEIAQDAADPALVTRLRAALRSA
ncbi:DNA glycosylase AlkZ-like family protein (plasmid) [Streptomyces sp. BI20]|uniref:DNA glycosylase AlkZ-like family protein n=1 Tax=Streptomyces sp. BI20 TaxID=3403460 RepID=UPI003C74A24E